MRMHNYFEVLSGGRSYFAKNTVTNAGQMLNQNMPYAAYMVLSGEDGSRVVRKTELVRVSKNVTAEGEFLAFDYSKGETVSLSATYSVELLGNECEGLVIRSIGFSPFEDGRQTANIALFDGVKKELGSNLIIRGTIYLSIMLSGAYFYGGENPLVEFLVGYRSINPTFSIMPYKDGQLPFAIDGANYTNLSGTGKGIKLERMGMAAGEDGAVLFLSNEPVLVVPCKALGATTSVSKIADNNGMVLAGGKNMEEAVMLLEGVEPFDVQQFREIVGVGKEATLYRGSGEEGEKNTLTLAKDGRLIGEPSGRFFACVSEKVVAVFDSQSVELLGMHKNHLQGTLSGEDVLKRVMLCSDGSVAFFGERLVIVSLDGTISELPISADDGGVIISNTQAEGNYIACTMTANFLMKYAINDGTPYLYGMRRVEEGTVVFRALNSIATVDGMQIEVEGFEGRDELLEERIASFCLANGGISGGDEGLIYNDGLILDLYFNSSAVPPQGSTIQNGLVLCPIEGDVEIRRFCPRTKQLKAIYRKREGLRSVVVSGDRLILLNKDGGLVVARLLFGDGFLRHSSAQNKSVVIKGKENNVASFANIEVFFDFIL